jgi:hypothetical protein
VQKVESFCKGPLEVCDSTAPSKRPSKTHKSVSLLEDTDSSDSEDAISEYGGTGASILPTGFIPKSSTQQNAVASSILRQSDLDLLSSNLQRVIIPSSATDKSKRKLDEEMSSRTRSRATNHTNDADGVFQQSPKAASNIFRMSGQGISQRRRMVIECKSLRSQVGILLVNKAYLLNDKNSPYFINSLMLTYYSIASRYRSQLLKILS